MKVQELYITEWNPEGRGFLQTREKTIKKEFRTTHQQEDQL